MTTRFSVACAAIAVLLALSGGCSEKQVDVSFKKLFEPRRSPQQYALIAFSDTDPDVRRDALTKLAGSKQFDRDWAIKGYTAIALLETNDQTRCIAIRALGRTNDPRAAETLIKILTYTMQPATEVRPPSDIVRWDATLGLAEISGRGRLPDDSRETVRDIFVSLLRTDNDYHVRTEAARGLGAFQSPEVVKALIAALRDEKFSVVHGAEDSLVRLTGVTERCSALAWEKWYAENEQDLFAHAGFVPESRRPPYSNGWEKARWNMRETWRFFFPGAKE